MALFEVKNIYKVKIIYKVKKYIKFKTYIKFCTKRLTELVFGHFIFFPLVENPFVEHYDNDISAVTRFRLSHLNLFLSHKIIVSHTTDILRGLQFFYVQ